MLRIFANSLDPDQARQSVGPGLDPLTIIVLEDLFHVSFEHKKKQQRKKYKKNYINHAKSRPLVKSV